MPDLLGIIKTFGLFVALAFLVATWILKKELQRKEQQGLLRPQLLPYQKGKKYLSKEKEKEYLGHNIQIYPHQRAGEIAVIALVAGLVGAKIFNALETWNEFIQDPIGSLFSGSGLTFYGGSSLSRYRFITIAEGTK